MVFQRVWRWQSDTVGKPETSGDRFAPCGMLHAENRRFRDGRMAQQRGLDEEAAVSLIVNGFAKEVLKELPMEFAVDFRRRSPDPRL